LFDSFQTRGLFRMRGEALSDMFPRNFLAISSCWGCHPWLERPSVCRTSWSGIHRRSERAASRIPDRSSRGGGAPAWTSRRGARWERSPSSLRLSTRAAWLGWWRSSVESQGLPRSRWICGSSSLSLRRAFYIHPSDVDDELARCIKLRPFLYARLRSISCRVPRSFHTWCAAWRARQSPRSTALCPSTIRYHDLLIIKITIVTQFHNTN